MDQHFDGCQLQCVPRISEGAADIGPQSLVKRFKRALAKPWNSVVKMNLKRGYRLSKRLAEQFGFRKKDALPVQVSSAHHTHLKAGDLVYVRPWEEIENTLDPFKELKGCAFLPYMQAYCGTVQRVLKPVERFLDERDYKVKKSRGIVLIEGGICEGTPVFGRCDRGCHLFWREEWLEKIDNPLS